MARVLLTDNEEEAMGILRMLNNGGNRAYEIINEHIKDPFQSLFLLKKIILLDPQKGKEELSIFLPSNIVKQVASIIYGKPQKAYFIVDSSMIGKMSSISFLGYWDFIKVYLMQNIHKKAKDQITDYLVKLGIERQQAEKLYQEALLISNENIYDWISKKFMFYNIARGKAKNDMVLFDNGFIYNKSEQKVYSYFTAEGKYKIPKSLFIKSEDKLREVAYPDSDLDSSALILEEEQDKYLLIMMPRELVNSMFVNLNFLAGEGLRHFKPFTDEKDGDEHVAVFEINWD
jgi:hypothetical protein